MEGNTGVNKWKCKSQRVGILTYLKSKQSQYVSTMVVGIRPNEIGITYASYQLFKANHTPKSFSESVRLDKKIIGILYLYYSDPRKTKIQHIFIGSLGSRAFTMDA